MTVGADAARTLPLACGKAKKVDLGLGGRATGLATKGRGTGKGQVAEHG